MDKMALLKIERNNDEMSEIMSLSEYIRTKLSMNEVNDLLQKKKNCRCCERHMKNRCLMKPCYESKQSKVILERCECDCRHDIRTLLDLLHFYTW